MLCLFSPFLDKWFWAKLSHVVACKRLRCNCCTLHCHCQLLVASSGAMAEQWGSLWGSRGEKDAWTVLRIGTAWAKLCAGVSQYSSTQTGFTVGFALCCGGENGPWSGQGVPWKGEFPHQSCWWEQFLYQIPTVVTESLVTPKLFRNTILSTRYNSEHTTQPHWCPASTWAVLFEENNFGNPVCSQAVAVWQSSGYVCPHTAGRTIFLLFIALVSRSQIIWNTLLVKFILLCPSGHSRCQGQNIL